MARKIKNIFDDIPLSSNINFEDNIGEFERKAKISPGTDLLFTKLDTPTIRVEKETNYLEWFMVDTNLPKGAFLGKGMNANVAYLNFTNIDFQIRTENYKGKVDYTVKQAPTGPIKIYAKTNMVPKVASLVDIGTDDTPYYVYKTIYWYDTNNVAVWKWHPLYMEDAIGVTAQGYYMEPVEILPGEWEVELYINPAIIAAATYPVTVDPTITEITNSEFIDLSNQPGCQVGYNGTWHVYGAQYAGGLKFYRSNDRFSTKSECAAHPFTDTDSKIGIVVFSDGVFGVFYHRGSATSGTIDFATYTAETDTWSSKISASGSFATNTGLAVCIDENDNAYVFCVDTSRITRLYKVVTKSTITLQAQAYNVARQTSGVGITPDWNGKLHVFYEDQFSPYELYYHQYTIATNSWNTKSTILTGAAFSPGTGYPVHAMQTDSNYKIHMAGETNNNTYIDYYNDIGGSPTGIYNLLNYIIGGMVLDKNDDVIMFVSEGTYIGYTSVYNGVSHTEALKWTNCQAWFYPAPVHLDNAKGGAIYCIGRDSVLGRTVFLEDDAYEFPGGSGSADGEDNHTLIPDIIAQRNDMHYNILAM